MYLLQTPYVVYITVGSTEFCANREITPSSMHKLLINIMSCPMIKRYYND